MSGADFEKIEQLLGKGLFDHQRAALDFWESDRPHRDRLCLYYKTGSGKTLTSLLCMWARVQDQDPSLWWHRPRRTCRGRLPPQSSG